MTDDPMTEPQTTDPHGLLLSGEELATLSELARLLGCSGRALSELLQGPLHARVRFVRSKPGPWRYSVKDALVAIEPHRVEIEARRQRAVELEASNRTAKAARIAATTAPAVKPTTMAPTTSSKPATKPTPKRSPLRARSPEVVIVARSAAPRKSEVRR
jgi:hypothetical protein